MADYLPCQMVFNLQGVSLKARRALGQVLHQRSMIDGIEMDFDVFLETDIQSVFVNAAHARHGSIADAIAVAERLGIDWGHVCPEGFGPLSITGRINGKPFQIDFETGAVFYSAWYNLRF